MAAEFTGRVRRQPAAISRAAVPVCLIPKLRRVTPRGETRPRQVVGTSSWKSAEDALTERQVERRLTGDGNARSYCNFFFFETKIVLQLKPIELSRRDLTSSVSVYVEVMNPR
jgi:hypothetical protein